MPEINLFNIFYRGGALGPKEIRQQALKRQEEEALRQQANEFSYSENKILSEAAANFSNDPYGFAVMMAEEYGAMADSLDRLIEDLGPDASNRLKQQRDKYRQEQLKYLDVVNSFDNLRAAIVRGDEKQARYWKANLSGYAVVYDVKPTGRITNMRIERISELPSKSAKTNIGIVLTGIDEEGRLIISARDVNKEGGMRVYVRGLDKSSPNPAYLGKFVLEWQPTTSEWVVVSTGDTGKRGEINWDLGIQGIQRDSLSLNPPGSIVKDSKGRMYYINYDGSYSYIPSKKYLEHFGIPAEHIYPLTPAEEESLPPLDVIKQRKPDPILDLIEKYNKEAEMYRKSAPSPIIVKMGIAGEWLAKRAPFLVKMSENVTGALKRIHLARKQAKPPRPLLSTEPIIPPPEDNMWRREAERFLQELGPQLNEVSKTPPQK